MKRATPILLALAVVALTQPALSQDATTDAGTIDKEEASKVFPSKPPYSPYAGRNFPTRPFFGDTHVHTDISVDAGAFGCRLGPEDAYRFAKGEELTASSGQRVRLARPLDFIVVADHSDAMGLFPLIFAGDPKVLATEKGRHWYELIQEGKNAEAAMDIILSHGAGTIPHEIVPLPGTPIYRSVWEHLIKAAEDANDPGRFTAFIGFEWTSNTGGNNLHRNVVFRDGADKASRVEPYTTEKPLGSDNPRDLWKWMTAYEEKTGGDVLAISHNGNLSNGRMFPIIESFTGKPIDREYAEQSAKWEHLYETTQIKGDGETHPFLSPNDEFADFETWDKGNLDLTVPKKPEMLEFEYARSTLKNGLRLERQLGINPYKFGLIGSTDTHTALSTADEDNFFGKATVSEPSPNRAMHPFVANKKTGLTIMGWETSASGYAAVWAKENTREAIFDAMERRETYATSGPRMIVRFFGGFDYEAKDANNRWPAAIGYAKGVPMGGDLHQAPAGKAPTFLVAALKDPIGANLDRYQIIKGWVDAQGQVHERVYDVAVSGGRTIDADGRCKTPVGNTVDVPNATWTNTLGAPELIAVWKDPEFDPTQSAFYYGRVIEIPTPRWTAYDALKFGVKMGPEVPMTIQDRAYTSPIWYTPGK